MVICKILRTFIIIIFFTVSSSVKSEINLLDRKVSAVDLILLKYEIFLTKNFNRLYQKSGIPQTMILYQYIDSTVKYNEENGFFVNIYAYMDRRRYTKEKKYSPKISDCNAVRNKIILNKMGYDFLSFKANNSVSEENINNSLINGVFNFPGLDEDIIKKTINNTSISINVVHPIRKNSFKCNGKINQKILN